MGMKKMDKEDVANLLGFFPFLGAALAEEKERKREAERGKLLDELNHLGLRKLEKEKNVQGLLELIKRSDDFYREEAFPKLKDCEDNIIGPRDREVKFLEEIQGALKRIGGEAVEPSSKPS